MRRRSAARSWSWREARGLVAVPLALIVAITVVNLATPSHLHLGPLLVAAPALAAVILGRWLTALTGVLALVGQVAIGVILGDLPTTDRIAQMASVVLVSVFSALLSALRERQVRELTQVRQVAEIAQRLVLRPLPPRIGPLRVAAAYLAAETEMQIGGDLYAAARTTSGTRLIVGDVRGKGLTAVGDAALLLGAFRAAAHLQAGLAELAAHLEAGVAWHLAESCAHEQAEEGFITAVLIDIPDRTPTIRMVHCGHPPPLLLRRKQIIALCARSPGPPLGLQLGLPCRQVETFDFKAGDTLLVYTDGVIEARNSQGVFYPLAERAAAWTGKRPQVLVEHLRTDLLAYAGGHLGDDAAMIAIERSGPVSAPREAPHYGRPPATYPN
ncbi:PP2C family protein-serine/threonine phosphatase [Microtetraspora malaysiensis]|uniref:PP2C family protein-serine/threonine phosphatase n=1 Tax=Microtetraspora malaysiensis TaxID=161358 RepID=UPI000A931314|nr:PP2C family protein-serine/threonine phosphatase [Microtetraspora malaysiensis]